MKKHGKLKIFIFIILSVVLAVICNDLLFGGILWQYAEKILNHSLKIEYIKAFNLKEIITYDKISCIRVILLSLMFMFIFLHLIFEVNLMYRWIYKYRYFIGFAFIAICVMLEISGSSINIWTNYIGGTAENIFGKSRPIRSDEWNVNTPMAFSQFFNKSGPFSYFASTFRGTKTDMFIVYGQPVRYWTIIFRPFQWGYLFLGLEKGLSFFWAARLVMLFLVTLEFIMLITKNKVLSASFAFLVTFSPIVQWWFAINGLVEMIIWGQLAVILTDRFMKSESYIKKIIYAAAFSISLGGYVLTFYPAWQIPLAYVFFGAFIYVIISNRKNYKLSARDFIIIFSAILVLIISLVSIFIKSAETIKLVLNTAYPGGRISQGGSLKMLYYLFRYPGSIFYPFLTSHLSANTCEMSEFIDFFPIGDFLVLFLLFIKKKKDILLYILLSLQLFFMAWILLPWPLWLSKLSLLSMSPPFRTMLALGFINILMAARSMKYLIDENIVIKYSYLIAAVMGTLVAAGSLKAHGKYFTNKMELIVLLGLIFIFYIILNGYLNRSKYIFLLFCILITYFAGISVNPVESGADVIYKNNLVMSVKNIDYSDPGIWIVEGMANRMVNNIPPMAGASTLNSTNIYPNLEAWGKLDKSGQYKDIYNRYAHILISLNKNEGTSFKLVVTDSFKINLDIRSLKDLNVKYILTKGDLTVFNSKNIVFEKIYDYNGFYIYKIKYTV